MTEQAFRSQRGPQTNDGPYFAFIASVYADACLSGMRQPLEITRKRVGYSARHTKRLLKEARDRGILTETQQGKAGGALTKKGRAALDTYNRREEENDGIASE